MANFGRVKTWGNETLQAADLNAEFDNIINNVTSGSVSSANIDLTDGYAWTGAHTFSVDMKVLNGAGLIVGNTAQVTTSSAGELQVLGTAAADSTAIIGHWAAAASGGTLSFVKSRNATIGSSTIVQDNDVLGTIEFMADDGSDFATPAASIFSRVNGTPGANDMPGELVLAVTADSGNSVTERVRVLQNGTVELNSATLSFDAAASIDTSGNNNLGLSAGTADVQITASNLTPASNDGSALGVSGTAWSDLFLASGAVANWNAGDITLTHSAGKLTFGGDGAVELDFNNHEMTNVDINSGAIDGADVTVGSGKTLDVSGGTLTLANDQISGDKVSGGTIGTTTITALAGALSLGDNNITNVGDIALDTISSDAGTSINVVLGSDAGDDFTVDTDKLVVEGDTGNVGIGTATPGGVFGGAMLEICKAATDSYIEVNCWRVTTTHSPTVLFQKSHNDSEKTLTTTTADHVLGSLQFHGVNTSNASSSAGRIQIEQDGNSGATFVPGRIVFKTATASSGVTERMRIDSGGNVGIGTATFGSSAAKVLAIANGTAPGTSADKAQLYVISGELIVKDGAGNATTLSPHNFGDGEPSEEMAWSYHSKRGRKSITVDMLRVVRLLEKLTGEQLAYIEEAA
jgi:hypothetical protein